RVRELGPLPVSLAIECIIQAARGLKAIFEAGIVHRDIKPSNLMLEPTGNVKLLDMGLARLDEVGGPFGAEGADTALTQSNVLMGTVDYMSPEQAFNPRSADHRSDIYSLGCTLYFLLSGKAPFTAETLVGRIVAHREHPIPSLAETRPDVPRRLENALKRLMAKSPDDRPATFEDVISLMESCKGVGLDPEPEESRHILPSEETTPRQTLPRWLRPAAIGAGSFVVVVGILAIGVYLGRSSSVKVEAKVAEPVQSPIVAPPPAPEAPKPPPPTIAAANPATPAPPPLTGSEDRSNGAAPESPEPKTIAPSVSVGLVREFKGHDRRVNSVAVSKDGLRAISGGADRRIGLWDVATGTEMRRMTWESPVEAVALTSDGSLGLSGHDDRSVHLWDLRSQHDVGSRKLDGHTGPVFAVAFALDNRVALSGGADRTVRVWDIEAGRADGTPLAHPS
ncbi:protein kinase domain-containing protein, partial [Singulisphaera rosea]